MAASRTYATSHTVRAINEQKLCNSASDQADLLLKSKVWVVVHELLSTQEMASADRLTIDAGTPGIALMEKAGRAVADVVARSHRAGARVLVLCGPGNNGGDGFVAARVLVTRGYRVDLALLGDRQALKGDAAEAAGRWTGQVLAIADAAPTAADVIVDALFGAGLARDLDGDARQIVERVNASGQPVVAVDVPSGIDGNTGAGTGRRGSGHRDRYVLPAEAWTPPVARPSSLRARPRGRYRHSRPTCLRASRPGPGKTDRHLWRGQFRGPSVAGHKYGRGHALVASGGIEGTGAARLAARGALRMGAGLVTVASPSDALAAHAASARRHHGPPKRRRGGPFGAACRSPAQRVAWSARPLGVGEETRAMVAAALAAGTHAVLDADALTSFSG